MFLKQYNYKPRSGSVGSQGGNDAQAQAQQAQQASQQQPAATAGSPPKDSSISAAAAGRRRVRLLPIPYLHYSFTDISSVFRWTTIRWPPGLQEKFPRHAETRLPRSISITRCIGPDVEQFHQGEIGASLQDKTSGVDQYPLWVL